MYSGVMAHGRIGAMHGGRRLVAGDASSAPPVFGVLGHWGLVRGTASRCFRCQRRAAYRLRYLGRGAAVSRFRWKFRAALIKMGMRFRGFVCYNILNSCITD